MSVRFNSSVNSLSDPMPALKFDYMNQNQGRSFGPLLGLFLVNFLAKAATAKYLSYFPYLQPYDPSPWLAYNKPVPNYNHHSYYSPWYPIKNPYEYQEYPSLTTTSPYFNDHHSDDYNDYHGHYDYPANTHYPYYDKLIPAASNNVHQQTTKQITKRTTPVPKKKTTALEKKSTTTTTTTTTTSPPIQQTTIPQTPLPETTPAATTFSTPIMSQEPVPAASNFNPRRQPSKNRRRGPSRGTRYPQRRRRPTTTPDYYDSYEDYYQSNQPTRRRRPQSAESYYDDYYDSFESTTRYFKKQKRRPTRKSNRNQNRNDDSFEIESNTEKFNTNTEIVIVRQAQTTTTAATTGASGTSTTEPTTLITNSTVSTTTGGGSNNNTYGYGPSNGNEQVSFTYGPPVAKYQYQVPYIDWYAQEETKNAIVKRVRDIVNIDERFK